MTLSQWWFSEAWNICTMILIKATFCIKTTTVLYQPILVVIASHCKKNSTAKRLSACFAAGTFHCHLILFKIETYK